MVVGVVGVVGVDYVVELVLEQPAAAKANTVAAAGSRNFCVMVNRPLNCFPDVISGFVGKREARK